MYACLLPEPPGAFSSRRMRCWLSADACVAAACVHQCRAGNSGGGGGRLRRPFLRLPFPRLQCGLQMRTCSR